MVRFYNWILKSDAKPDFDDCKIIIVGSLFQFLFLQLQLQAKSIIFDPVFSQRCSPSQFFGPKRFVVAIITLVIQKKKKKQKTKTKTVDYLIIGKTATTTNLYVFIDKAVCACNFALTVLAQFSLWHWDYSLTYDQMIFLKFIFYRYRPVPLTIEELPPIDVCCISHDHYDHMDSSSIRQINQLNPNAKWSVWFTNDYSR